MSDTPSFPAYEELIGRVREASLLGSTASLLSWDQETMMPARAVGYRGRQLAQLARLRHEMVTAPKLGELLHACEAEPALTADPLAPPAVNLREVRRGYDRATRLPGYLVAALAETSALSRAAWVEARRAGDFTAFRPWLEKVLELTRRKAECYGHPADGEAWDALAEDYDPGLTARAVEAVFTPLRPRLAALVVELMDCGQAPTQAFEQVKLPVDQQRRVVRWVAEQIGFDFAAGRLDDSAHPFCSGFCVDDVRLTTRFHEDMLADALGSTMHEAGHGIYSQNLPRAHEGTPMGEDAGLSIHESQSRLWENFVGRSRAFWEWCYPHLRAHFGQVVAHLSFEDVYHGVNRVQPSLIRVEADEATYNLHIMIRFELERALVRGDLAAADLPAAWNECYRRDLGVEVPDDRRGCLQDIHWAMGAIGYFPTYALGNLHAAQFFEAAEAALGDLQGQICRGDFAPLRGWLREKIHQQGMRFRAGELCERVTGQPLSPEPLLRHLAGKLRTVYGL